MSGYHWHSVTNIRSMPPGAIQGGKDTNNDPIFVGQAPFRSMKLPAKVVPNKGRAYVSYDGNEHEVTRVEVLCQRTVEWVHSSNGNVLPGAIEGGRDESGERLYIGRAHHAGSMTVGKIHPSHRCLYISYAGGEHKYNSYEMLVYR